jgi:imidazolonepropionase-like amidohydrolase
VAAGVIASLMAGFDTVQHASFVDDRTFDVLEMHPGFTLGVYRSIMDRGPVSGYPAAARDQLVSRWSAMLASVRLAYDRGVPFAAGSDCGGAVHPHGLYAHHRTRCARGDIDRSRRGWHRRWRRARQARQHRRCRDRGW